MKKHRVLFNIINNIILFFVRYCTYLGVRLYLVLSKSEGTKAILRALNQNIIANRILKKSSNKSRLLFKNNVKDLK